MKQKRFLNHALQEGIFFLLISGALLWYSLESYSSSFNKDWSQSPSLFPVVISLLLGVLSVILLVQGVREKAADRPSGGRLVQTLIVIGISLLYYLALSVIKMPYLAISVSSLVLNLSTFEVATIVFLLGLMLYLGVRSLPVLVAVPLGTTVFLSVMFRTLLHVLLP